MASSLNQDDLFLLGIGFFLSFSFGDVSGATMYQDMDKLGVGIFLMVVYVIMVLSRFNWLELRVSLCFYNIIMVAFFPHCFTHYFMDKVVVKSQALRSPT